MHRRKYILSAVAGISVAGCLDGNGESDDPGNETDDDTDDTDPFENGDDQDDEVIDGDDQANGVDGGDDTEEPAESVTDAAVHHWPLAERSGRLVVDTISDAHGTVRDGLENVEGEWHENHAEYHAEESQGHIDLGYLESINEAVTNHAFALIATVELTTLTPDRSMTILGAGGGESDWFEFRISESDGSRNGQPVLLIRDNLANEIRVAVPESLESDTAYRIAVSMEGNTAEDVTAWVNGTEAETQILQSGALSTFIVPDQSYGIFASNPDSETTIGTRRWFRGTIDNVIFCDQPISEEAATQDFEDQPWSE